MRWIMRANREIQDIIGNNAFLFAIVVAGIVIMAIGYTPYVETLVVLGTAFIISSAVGIYMMLATRQVARKPPERFNEQNIILHKIDADILHSLKLHGFYGYHHF